MPIDFPSNPLSGQTYSYAGQQWQYNGVAWDKLIIADDANSLYGISGSIYASNLATGLLYGGIISINAGNTAQFDITAGRGQIVAAGSTYTSGPNPTFQYVNWPGQTGITLTYLATNDTTWVYIDSAGVLNQRTEYYTDEQIEENIIIGQLVHPSRTFINLARTNPNVAYATDKQYEQFIRSFGPIKISGHTIQPNGANLKLNRTSGTAFSLGRNWINDTDNPSVVSDPAQTDCTFFRYYRGATAGTFITVPNQTAIDPTKYDDGTGTLATVPGGKYTIQRIFYYPNTPTLLGVYYGRAEYTSLADAAANINFENFTEIENTKTNAIFAGYLLVKSGATDLTNTSDALILQAGNFRSTTSGGGSVSLTLDDLTDVIISSPQNYQVLTYVDGVTGWENVSVTSLPLVSSFNGLTGAVTGVTTGTANTFGPLQSFTNGISLSGGMTLAGGTFNLDANIDLKRPSNSTTTIQAYYSPAPGFYSPTSYISLSSNYGITFGGGLVNVPGYVNVDTSSLPVTSGTVPLIVKGSVTPFPQFANMTDWINGSGTILSSILVGGGFSGPASNFSGLVTANAGISSVGGTFSGNIRLQNAEYIQNTTNGRIDFMPAPSGSTHYGLYVDTTSWGYGPRLGTIRSSDSALNTAGILWDAPLTIGSNTRFNLTSDSSHAFLVTTTGNDTLQVGIRINSTVYSGAMALVDDSALGAANRSPGVTHANPNLYIYRAGSARATDFIRFEHDGNTGYMISGGTTDIELMPGSGIVGVSGNIQVLQNQIYVTNNARSWFL